MSSDIVLKPNSPEALRRARRIVISTMAGTTWRISIPSILGATAGLFADLTLRTKPWLTIMGLVFGFLVAALLIWRQIKELAK